MSVPGDSASSSTSAASLAGARLRVPTLGGAPFSLEAVEPSPCTTACPAGINVKAYVSLIAEGMFAEALAVVRDRCPLPGICGRICHHPCEAACRRDQPIAIRALKRFVADVADETPPPMLPVIHAASRVAIVGSGPAGLAAAWDLRRAGYPVTIFESEPEPGGMLRYGIAPYRLPREVLDAEIGYLLASGIELQDRLSHRRRPGARVAARRRLGGGTVRGRRPARSRPGHPRRRGVAGGGGCARLPAPRQRRRSQSGQGPGAGHRRRLDRGGGGPHRAPSGRRLGDHPLPAIANRAAGRARGDRGLHRGGHRDPLSGDAAIRRSRQGSFPRSRVPRDRARRARRQRQAATAARGRQRVPGRSRPRAGGRRPERRPRVPAREVPPAAERAQPPAGGRGHRHDAAAGCLRRRRRGDRPGDGDRGGRRRAPRGGHHPPLPGQRPAGARVPAGGRADRVRRARGGGAGGSTTPSTSATVDPGSGSSPRPSAPSASTRRSPRRIAAPAAVPAASA